MLLKRRKKLKAKRAAKLLEECPKEQEKESDFLDEKLESPKDSEILENKRVQRSSKKKKKRLQRAAKLLEECPKEQENESELQIEEEEKEEGQSKEEEYDDVKNVSQLKEKTDNNDQAHVKSTLSELQIEEEEKEEEGRSKKEEEEEEVTMHCHLSAKEWTYCEPPRGDPKKEVHFRTGYNHVFKKAFSMQDPRCGLHFVSNRVKVENSRKRNVWWGNAKAICTAEGCKRTFHFIIWKKPKQGEIVPIEINCTGVVSHGPNVEVRSHASNIERERVAKDSQGITPVEYYYKTLGELNQVAFDHGNFTSNYKPDVIRKARKEVLSKDSQGYIDMVHDVKVMKDTLDHADIESKHIKGFIQTVCASPFVIHMYSEEQVELWWNCFKDTKGFISFDATGQVVRNYPGSKKKTYYYAVVVKTDEDPPIPICEMLTNDNTTPIITCFLMKFLRDSQEVHKSLIPKQVEVDFSWAILNATCLAFLRCSVSDYLQKSWIAEKMETVVHICSTHILRAMYRNFPSLPKEQNKFLKLVCARLIDTQDKEDSNSIYRDVVILYTSQNATDLSKKALQNLQNAIEMFESDDSDADSTVQETIKTDETYEEVTEAAKTIKEKSPYYHYFKSTHTKFCNDDVRDEDLPENPYFSPQVPSRLLENYLYLYPLISGILTEKSHSTNSYVELWMRLLKYDILQKEKFLPPTTFISKVHRSLKGRMRHVDVGKRRKRRLALEEESLSQAEIWDRTPNKKQNTLFEKQQAPKAKSKSKLSSRKEENLESKTKLRVSTKEELPKKKKRRLELEESQTETSSRTPKKDKKTVVEKQQAPKSKSSKNQQRKAKSKSKLSTRKEENTKTKVKLFAKEEQASKNEQQAKWESILEELARQEDFDKIGNLTRMEFRSLRPETWLNGSVIDAYFELLANRSSQSNDQKRFPKIKALQLVLYDKITGNNPQMDPKDPKCVFKKYHDDLREYDLVFCPCFEDMNHFTLIVFDMKEKSLEHYDSMNRLSDAPKVMQNYMDKYITSLTGKSLKFKIQPTRVTMQQNNYDCGVFVCQNAEKRARQVPVDTRQEDMRDKRKQMMIELYHKELYDSKVPQEKVDRFKEYLCTAMHDDKGKFYGNYEDRGPDYENINKIRTGLECLEAPLSGSDNDVECIEEDSTTVGITKSTIAGTTVCTTVPENAERAPTGLHNYGSTCYMNATIQCLNSTPSLVNYILKDYLKKKDCHLRDTNRGKPVELIKDFAELIKELQSRQHSYIEPINLMTTFGQIHHDFCKIDQEQDAGEFLTLLLDELHEGLNTAKKRPQTGEQDYRSTSKTAYEYYRNMNSSVIVNLFQGQFKFTRTCLVCDKKRVHYEPATRVLTLCIPATTECSLNDCIKETLEPENLTGTEPSHCPSCKINRDTQEQITFSRLPDILIIYLKRFQRNRMRMWDQKKTTKVNFPTKLTSQELGFTVKASKPYHLYGVTSHIGSRMDGGHYVASCRDPGTKRWHMFNDERVENMNESDVHTRDACMLYYSRIDE